MSFSSIARMASVANAAAVPLHDREHRERGARQEHLPRRFGLVNGDVPLFDGYHVLDLAVGDVLRDCITDGRQQYVGPTARCVLYYERN